jgi:putative transposase
MNTPSINRYKNHRFPVEIISHGVWLYFRFCLSYRDVEELLLARGILVTLSRMKPFVSGV